MGGFRGSGAGKSGSPWSALHFGVGGRHFGDSGVIWARKCKSFFTYGFLVLKNKNFWTSGYSVQALQVLQKHAQ